MAQTLKNIIIRSQNEKYLWLVIFIISLVLSFYAPLKYHYPTAPGLDTYVHLLYVAELNRVGLGGIDATWPGGFHLLVIWVAKLFHLTFEYAIGLVGIFLMPLLCLCYGLLARKLMGIKGGLITYLLLAFVSLQPLQTYYDGTFPNLMATGILLPLTILAWIQFAENRRHQTKRLIWSAIGLIGCLAIILTHHFTTLMMTIILFMWLLLISLSILWKIICQKKYLLAGIGILVIGISIYALIWSFFHLTVFHPARAILNTYLISQKQFPYFAPSGLPQNPKWTMSIFGTDMAGIVFQGGILGALIWLLKSAKKKLGSKISDLNIKTTTPDPVQKTFLFLFIWLMIYWFGATRSWTGEPTRLARDLALPASIFATYAGYYIYNSLKKINLISAWIFVFICLMSSWPFAVKRLSYQTHTTSALFFSNADEQAYQYLLANNQGTTTDLVLAQPLPWDTIIRLRGNTNQFNMAHALESYTPSNQDKHCILTEKHTDPNLSQEENGAQYRETPYTTQVTFSDASKIVTISCRE